MIIFKNGKMRKNIDLSDETVKTLSIQAIENGTNFKNYVESKLEELAKTKLPQGQKRGEEKIKNYFHKSSIEALHPLADNGLHLYLVAEFKNENLQLR